MGAFTKRVYTYIYCTSVKNYLLDLLGSFVITDIIIPHITQLTSLLFETACRLLEPIKIYFNFIEFSDGFYFDKEGKTFIRNPKRLKGSPQLMRVTYTMKTKFQTQSRLLNVWITFFLKLI